MHLLQLNQQFSFWKKEGEKDNKPSWVLLSLQKTEEVMEYNSYITAFKSISPS